MYKGIVSDDLNTLDTRYTKLYETWKEAHDAAEKLCKRTMGNRGSIGVREVIKKAAQHYSNWMKVNVKGAIWNIELPKAVKPGYYGIASFKCLTDDELSFSCTWEQPEAGKERQAARKCILNRLAE